VPRVFRGRPASFPNQATGNKWGFLAASTEQEAVMKKRRFTEKQIVAILKEAGAGVS